MNACRWACRAWSLLLRAATRGRSTRSDSSEIWTTTNKHPNVWLKAAVDETRRPRSNPYLTLRPFQVVRLGRLAAADLVADGGGRVEAAGLGGG